MNECTLILAAHGSRHDPAANDIVRSHADRIRRRATFRRVSVAFHQGDPSFATALDDVAGEDVVVVPLMTSAGYYADTVLPAALDAHPRRERFRLTITGPVGAHGGMVELVRARAALLARRFGFVPAATSVVVIGHGTTRHQRSRATTCGIAEALRSSREWSDCVAVFLDETPLVDDVHTMVAMSDVIVIPFLIGGGSHAGGDVPVRLGMPVEAAGAFPRFAPVNDRRLVCDAAVGTHSEIADLAHDLAVTAAAAALAAVG